MRLSLRKAAWSSTTPPTSTGNRGTWVDNDFFPMLSQTGLIALAWATKEIVGFPNPTSQEKANNFCAVSPRILARSGSGAKSNITSNNCTACPNAFALPPNSPQIILSAPNAS